MSKAVTIGFRENSRNPGHVRVSVFVGRNKGARGNAGEIVLRTDEWDEIRQEIQGSKDQPSVINFAADNIDILASIEI